MVDLDISPSEPTTWVVGFWTSQCLFVNKGQFSDGLSNWGVLKWDEENTEDETEAYVRVDILNASGIALVEDIQWLASGVNIGDTYSALVGAEDIYVRFKLYSYTKKPIVKNATLDFAKGGLN